MNLDDLRLLQSNERSSPQLQEVEKDLYRKIAEYVRALDENLLSIGDPDDPKAQKIRDERESARRVVEGIFERRLGKIIRLASLKASGLGKSPKNLTPEEQEMFDQLAEALEKGRAAILGPIVTPPSRRFAVAEKKEAREKAKEKEITESHLSEERETKEEFLTIRVLRDIPTFMGVDGRSYKLAEEDIVVLRATNARVLLERKVAIPVSISMPREGSQ